jgi:predicted aminopeptidase
MIEPDSLTARLRPTLTSRRPQSRRAAVRNRLAFAALLLAAGAGLACGSLGYSLQALAGGAGILARREPINRVLRRADLPAEERRQLELAVALREFAIHELALPDNRSYRSYVRLGRDVVTWNVVAAPPLSVEPVTWCFPVAGCVSYRGYFKERSAHQFAAKLAAKGDDVTVTGATAYSTLGWFADPILDTFLNEEPWRLAGILFHELAHQVAYAEDDTAFNESFATAVEELGVERWLATRTGESGEAERAACERDRREERRFGSLLLAARAELAASYAGEADASAKRTAKQATLLRLGAAVDRALDDGGLGARYAGWRAHAWNNADLAAVADYTLWVPALKALYAQSGGFAAFFDSARSLASLSTETRRTKLETLANPADTLR